MSEETAKNSSRKSRSYYLAFPLLLFAVYFLTEKSCAIDKIKLYTQSDAVHLYFDYKENLLEEMAEIYRKNQTQEKSKRKKIFMILGSSRLMFFDYKSFARNFPQWELFNFSAPVTSPAYYAYILDKALRLGVHPDYLLIETDPYQYNEKSSVFLRSNVAYGFDFSFILRNYSLFKNDEISYFLARNLFMGYRYPPHPDNLYGRIKDDSNSRIRALKELNRHQRANRGAGMSLFLRENFYETNFRTLEVIARRDLRRLYSHYRISKRQLDFLEQILSRSRSQKIEVLLVRPPVSRPLNRLMRQDRQLMRAVIRWEKLLRKRIASYDARYEDLEKSKEFSCNTFVDASHMSLDCYHPLLRLAMDRYYEARANKTE